MDSNSARPSLSSGYHVETSSLSTAICVRDRSGPALARAGHPRVETTRRIVRALLLTPDTTSLAHLVPSVRKQIKIRPGFTPQEDVSRFRGTRQQAMDATALPKGHILGWVAPSSDAQPKAKGASAPPPNKNARKRANQRAKKAAEKSEAVKDSWEDEEDAESGATCKTDDGAKEGSEVASEPSRDEAEITDKFTKLTVE